MAIFLGVLSSFLTDSTLFIAYIAYARKVILLLPLV
jgi:hypothetical protein